MKKRIVVLLFLDALFGGFLLFGQTISVEKIANSANGVPLTALAGSERREYVNVIFERDSVTSWVAAGGSFSNATFTVPGHHFVPGDVFRMMGFTTPGSGWANQMQCQVQSVTSTTITVYQPQCNQGVPDSGSGTEPSAIIWKVGSVAAGTPTNAHVKWEVYTTVGTETFYLMSRNKARFAGAAGCTLAKAIAHDASCYGSGTQTLDDELSGPGIYIEIGPTQGDCTWTGAVATSNLQLHSTIEFDVKATSKADPTKSHIEHYLVCKNGAGSGKPGVVKVSPGYFQAYKNFPVQLEATVFGAALGTQPVHWTIDSTDHLGGTNDASIDFPDSLNPVFNSGTAGGGYILKACLQSDGTVCAKQRMWVAKTQTKPAGNADAVIQTPCEVDPVMTDYGGEDIEVGKSGYAYSSLKVIPLNTGQWHWGATIRIHNDGAAGNPDTWKEYFATNSPANLGPNDGTVPQFHLCGVPNQTTGEAPVIDGLNSTGASWLNTFTQAGASLFTFGGYPTSTLVYDGNPLKSNHVLINSLHFKNATLFTPYTLPNGNPSYYSNSSAVRQYGTENFTVASIFTEDVAMPLFSDCNTNQSGWKNCSVHAYWFGNHGAGYGIRNGADEFSTEHYYYEQSLDTFVLGSRGDGSVSGAATGMYSFRPAGETHFAYNFLNPIGGRTSASGPGGASENQDANTLFDPNRAFAAQGATDCSLGDANAPWCPSPAAVFGAVNTYAAFQEEHYHTFWNYGNATFMNGGATFTAISQTHDLTDISLTPNLYAYHNVNRTLGYYPFALLETWRGFRPDSPSLGQPVQWAGSELQNNDIYTTSNPGCSYGACGTHEKASAGGMTNYTSNTVHTGQYVIGTVNAVNGWDAGSPQNGLNSGWDFHDFTDVTPVEGHIGGWTTSNFVFASSDPVNSLMKPQTGSPDIGAATPLVWPMNLYQPRFNAVDSAMNTWAKRTDPTTIGAYDPVGAPTPVSIAYTPNPLSVAAGGNVVGVCTTTLSDSSARNCFSPACTSTNTAAATISGLTVTGVATGTGNISCTAESLSAPSVPFTVTAGPTVVSIAMAQPHQPVSERNSGAYLHGYPVGFLYPLMHLASLHLDQHG
jgi:hypothetical protein